MKFIALFLILTGLASAAEVKVTCSMSDVTYVNQFSLEGSFENTTGSFEAQNFVIDLRPAGNARDTRVIDVVRDGTVTAFPAGQLTLKPFFVITSADRNEDLVYINLVVDYPAPLTSQVRFADGMTYSSICQSK